MFNITNRITKRLAVVGAAAVLTIGSGVAWAAWTASGTGTAAAQAGQAVGLTSTAGTTSDKLFPGGSADIVLMVVNTNSFAMTLDSVSVGTVDAAQPSAVSGGVGGCNPANSSVTGPSPRLVDTTATVISIPANNTATPVLVTLTDKAHMGNDSDDTCQNATFDFTVTLVGHASS